MKEMFEVNGKSYKLHYTEGRLELIENKIGKSVVSDFIKSDGALPIATIKSHFAFALVCEDDPDGFVKPKDGMAVASEYMKQHGYASACDLIANSLEQDMGFLFRAN